MYIPVLNIQSHEYSIRTEHQYFLEQENSISADLLTFRDHIELTKLHQTGKLVLTLVDHNVLTGSDGDLEDDVVEVIDHHKRERQQTDGYALTFTLINKFILLFCFMHTVKNRIYFNLNGICRYNYIILVYLKGQVALPRRYDILF